MCLLVQFLLHNDTIQLDLKNIVIICIFLLLPFITSLLEAFPDAFLSPSSLSLHISSNWRLSEENKDYLPEQALCFLPCYIRVVPCFIISLLLPPPHVEEKRPLLKALPHSFVHSPNSITFMTE